MSLRSAFAEAVTQEMERDEKIILLLGDIGVHSFRKAFAACPERCLNLGACESGMVGFAAGLALEGFYPIVSCIEAHLLRRAYEFIRLGFTEQNLEGLFVGVGGEDEYRKLGPTHQCPEGRYLARQCFEYIYFPESENDLREMIHDSIAARDLTYIRLEERS